MSTNPFSPGDLPSYRAMPTKSKKLTSHSSRPAKKSGNSKTTKKRSSSAKTPKTKVDILSPSARENAYFICHNAADCLRFRGFGPSANKKKK